VIDKLGWHNYSPNFALIRRPVAYILAQLNNSKAIDRLFELWAKRNIIPLLPDMKPAVYYALVRYNGTEGTIISFICAVVAHRHHLPLFSTKKTLTLSLSLFNKLKQVIIQFMLF
jgi:hypothetical protein